jgi:hypothetical protein
MVLQVARKNLKLLEPAFKKDALAYLFQDKLAARSVVENIPDDFYEEDPDLGIVFQIFKHFVVTYGDRPRRHEMEDEILSWCKKFKYDDTRTKAVLLSFKEIWNRKNYTASRVKDKLFDAITAHHMYVVATQIDEYVDEGKYDELIQAFSRARNTGSEEPEIIEYWGDATERALRRKLGIGRVIPTGMAALDKLISGGVPPGALAMLMGASGHGKSALLGQFALASSLAGYKTAYITLELSQDQIMGRMDAHNSGIPLDAIPVKGAKVVSEIAGVFATNSVPPGELYVQYFPTKSISITQVEEYLDRLRRERGVTLDALFVDYLGLMRMVGSYQSQWEALQENCSLLRGVAGKYQMVIWTADQTNRGGMGKEIVDMDDISGSFGKVFPLDLMINISQTKAEKLNEVFRLNIAKSRLGPANKQVWVEPNFALMRFEGVDEDEAKRRGLVVRAVGSKKKAGGGLHQMMGTQGP